VLIKGKGGLSPTFTVPQLTHLANVILFNVSEEISTLNENFGTGQITQFNFKEQSEALAYILQLRKKQRVDGVVTFSETMLSLAAQMAELLGVPHHSPKSVQLMQDKFAQRQALKEAGPQFALIRTKQDLNVALHTVTLPAVFKPVYGGGSLVTFKIETRAQLTEAYKTALELYPKSPIGHGREVIFVLEEMLLGANWHGDDRFGDYVSVESLICDGEIYHVAVTDHTPLAVPFRETGDIFPSILPYERLSELFDMTSRALRAVGATNGATHTELKLTEDGPRIIEVNGRVGGLTPWFFEATSDFNIVNEVGKIALGQRIVVNVKFHQYILFMTEQSPAEKVRVAAISGVEQAQRIPGLRHLTLLTGIGDVPNWEMGDGTVLAYSFLASAVDALWEMQATLHDSLRITYNSVALMNG
jgi:biotin carboxylase